MMCEWYNLNPDLQYIKCFFWIEVLSCVSANNHLTIIYCDLFNHYILIGRENLGY